jgi:hypothetical protein
VLNYRRMTATQRFAAADGRYLAGDSVRAKAVLLIDDVVTTGAQAGDASRALIAAGTADLRVACVARTVAAPDGAPPRHRGVIGSLEGRYARFYRLRPYDQSVADRVVHEVVCVEALAMGGSGSRRAVVRWSDGSVGEALRWWGDEVLFCEGDLLGKTEAQLRSLHFRRDREYLRSDPA